jgi:phosphoribosyl-ATP pyrophosphohydrolase
VTFEEICALAAERKRTMPEGSATTALLAGGVDAIGKKLVEEAAESWMAARYETRSELSAELSQVLYYVAVMMAAADLELDEVYASL